MSYIPALILQQDHSVFIDTVAGTIGQTMLVPTPNSGGQIDSDFWAEPITGFGIEGTGFKYTPTTPDSVTPPSVQAFHVVRIITAKQSTDWYALGTSTEYILASDEAECCSASSPVAIMPTVGNLPVIAPTSLLCNQDAVSGAYFGIWAIPTPTPAGKQPTVNGYYNNNPMDQVRAANIGALITALNADADWRSIGLWSSPDGVITLKVTQAPGPGTDTVALVITFS